MPILTVNNTPYNYPDPGSDPGWGEDATGWAEEVTSVLSNLLGPGDILETTSNILNNQTSFADITSMTFSNAVVRAANIDYSIIRSTDSTNVVESGTIYLTYNNISGIWYLSSTSSEAAGVIFSVTSLGQVQYKSSSLSGTNYSGEIVFRAKTLSQ